MVARALAEAFVRLRPDLSGFRTEATGGLKAALAGVVPEVRITASTDAAKAQALTLRGQIQALYDKAFAAKIVVDDKQTRATLTKLTAQLVGLDRRVANPKVTLEGVLKAEAQLGAMDTLFDKLAAKTVTAHVDVTGDAVARMALLTVQIADLERQAGDIKIGVTDPQALAKIAVLKAAVGELANQSRRIDISVGLEGLGRAETEVAALAHDFGNLAVEMSAANRTGLGLTNRWFPMLSRWLPGLQNRISLFGGALHGVLPAAFAAVTGLHLLIDSIIEIAAVLIPAAVAFTAFGLAAVPTVQAIVAQMQHMNTVTQATGKSLYPLTNGFQALSEAIRPQVLQLFGDGLTILAQKGGAFHQMIVGTGTALDQMAARFTVAVTNGQGFGDFLKFAVNDLTKLGDVIGNLAGVFANVFRAVPGYAQTLLGLADAGTKVLEWASRVAEPLLAFGLKAHGAFLYAGLAATFGTRLIVGALNAVSGIAQASGLKLLHFGSAGRAAASGLGRLADLARGASRLPWGWISVAAVAIGFLAYKILTAKDAAGQWIAQQEQILAQVPAYKGYTALFDAQVATFFKLADAQHTYAEVTRSATAEQAKQARVVGMMGQEVQLYHDKIVMAKVPVTELTGQQKKLAAQTQEFSTNLNRLGARFGGTTTAMGLVRAAGITLGQMLDTTKHGFALIVTQVLGTIRAYQAMGQTSGALGADMNAMNIAASDQVTQMGKLNTALDAVMGVVQGGQGTFVAFQQDLLNVTKAAKPAAASMDGLNKPSLTLRAAWQKALGDGGKLIDALRMMSSVSPGGFPSLTKALKLTLAELLPMGKKTAATRAELVSMAQEINPNIRNFKQLTAWLGNTKDAGGRLNALVAKMGINIQDLAKDAKKMSDALQSFVISKFEIARLNATHASAAISKLAQDVTNTGTSARTIHRDELTLISDLVRSGMSAKGARTLMASMTGTIFDAGKTARQKHQDFITLYNDFRASGKGAKEAWQQAEILTGWYHKIPKNVHTNVSATGSGSGRLTLHEQVAGQNSQGFLEFHARGTRIPGFGGGDKHPALLEGGEAVIDKWRTKRLAPLFAAMGVPGFAGGGVAGLGHQAYAVGPWMTRAEGAFEEAGERLLVRQARASARKIAREFSGGIPGDVQSYAGVATEVLRMLGQPVSDLGIVLKQIATESGGRPTAVNLTDSNAAAGTPSVGLLQVIGPTFDAYAGRFRGVGPFEYGVSVNPLANIFAGMNYATHRYDGFWTSVLGQGHGYDSGGWLKPGLTMAYNGTGRPERVLGPGEGAGNTYHLSVNVAPGGNPAEVGRQVVHAIREFERRSGTSWRK